MLPDGQGTFSFTQRNTPSLIQGARGDKRRVSRFAFGFTAGVVHSSYAHSLEER